MFRSVLKPRRLAGSRPHVFVVGFIVALIALSLGAGTAQAAITFDGSPGTAAPPATLGGYTMTPFGVDPQALAIDVPSVVDPAGTVSFSPVLNHRQIGSGWATWSHGYTGDVYYSNGATSVTLTLPADTGAFYLYVEPNPFASYDVTATSQEGATSGAVAVDGSSGAKYFGFSASGGSTIATITVSSTVDFAIGEFGISAIQTGPILVYSGNGALDEGYTKFGTAAGKTVETRNVLPADLSSYDCIVLPINGVAFSGAQNTQFSGYVNGGGRLVALAEHEGFPGSITTMNGVATALGADMSVVADSLDNGFTTTFNIDATPYTFGVSSIRLAASSEVSVVISGSAVSLVRSTGGTTVLGAEAIGSGLFVLSGDSNIFSDTNDTGYTVEDNGTLVANLCGASPTTTTYTGGTTVQYSDSVTLSGRLLDESSTGIFGKQLDFTLGTQNASASPTDASGDASTSLQVLQPITPAVTVNTAFAGDAFYAPSSDSDAFTITKEDCTVAYTGDTLVNAANMTTLKAQFGELDSSLGDWSGKTITFTLTGADATVQTFTAVTNAAGVAQKLAALGPNVYGVVVSFVSDNYYKACTSPAAPNDTLLTVQDAAAKITGGGWVSVGVGNTNFGFNVIRDVTGLKGQLQVRMKGGKDRFHSTSVLTLVQTGANSGYWTGTGKWNGVAGSTFTIKVVDNGSSGKKGDTISIVIKTGATTVFTTGATRLGLKGGNIVVHW